MDRRGGTSAATPSSAASAARSAAVVAPRGECMLHVLRPSLRHHPHSSGLARHKGVAADAVDAARVGCR
eukprot:2184437-Pleurochrysis_carterae.AAC.1